ncbi:hypothetical protein BK666_20020 [Pseudomonas frederiksbergensis]|uniref:HEPN AbiU2-like domain-containing protein n=1 Tax=Pseudomonas frederiksbergensis TaxID=104087 RepID=A0A423JZE3_9PSED|nr:hypothetical protein [Pseudomonas frederiksbergensis]RON43374.1 hypothetical protein BK666_20020 [Pseudomonas frederiksbergensis]
MIDFENTLITAHDRLNSAYTQYECTTDELARKFYELVLQSCIFQYEICVEMASIIRNKPMGFSLNVALKGLVHRLFEYNKILESQIIKKLLHLCSTRNILIDRTEIKSERKKWKSEFHKLESWAATRNYATGHYDPNFEKQMMAVLNIELTEVMDVCAAFISFNMSILKILLKAGRGNCA